MLSFYWGKWDRMIENIKERMRKKATQGGRLMYIHQSPALRSFFPHRPGRSARHQPSKCLLKKRKKFDSPCFEIFKASLNTLYIL
jgi:hypothetical protein